MANNEINDHVTQKEKMPPTLTPSSPLPKPLSGVDAFRASQNKPPLESRVTWEKPEPLVPTERFNSLFGKGVALKPHKALPKDDNFNKSSEILNTVNPHATNFNAVLHTHADTQLRVEQAKEKERLRLEELKTMDERKEQLKPKTQKLKERVSLVPDLPDIDEPPRFDLDDEVLPHTGMSKRQAKKEAEKAIQKVKKTSKGPNKQKKHEQGNDNFIVIQNIPPQPPKGAEKLPPKDDDGLPAIDLAHDSIIVCKGNFRSMEIIKGICLVILGYKKLMTAIKFIVAAATVGVNYAATKEPYSQLSLIMCFIRLYLPWIYASFLHTFAFTMLELLPTQVVKLTHTGKVLDEDESIARHPNNRLSSQTRDLYKEYQYKLYAHYTIPDYIIKPMQAGASLINWCTGSNYDVPTAFEKEIPFHFAEGKAKDFGHAPFNFQNATVGSLVGKYELVSLDILQRVTSTATVNLLNGVESLHSRVQNAINSNTDACLVKEELKQSSVNGTVNYLSYSLRELNHNNPNKDFQKGAINTTLNMGIESFRLEPGGDPLYQPLLKTTLMLLIYRDFVKGYRKLPQSKETWESLSKVLFSPTLTLLIRFQLFLAKLRDQMPRSPSLTLPPALVPWVEGVIQSM